MSSACLQRHPAVAYLFLVRSMRLAVLTLNLIAAAVLASCVSPDDPRRTGVSRDQAADISRAVRAQKHAHQIYRCTRWPDGMIIIQTDVGDYSARRVGDKWEFIEMVILGRS
jgi:hypothetical protein